MAKSAGSTKKSGAKKHSVQKSEQQELNWQLEAKIEALMENASATKIVTCDELAALSLSKARLEALRQRLTEENVTIVDVGEDEDDEKEVELISDEEMDTDDTLSEDNVRQYMKEIRRVKLLTAQEEWDLARRIKQGDQDAENQLVEANMRLAVSIARKYNGRGLPILDLIQEGNRGLMEAARKYDPEHKSKKAGDQDPEKATKLRFSTCATLYINRNIKRALYGARMIRLPENKVEFVRRANVFEAKIRMEFNRVPTEEELIQNEMDQHALPELEREKRKLYNRQPTPEEIAAKRQSVRQLVQELPALKSDITSYDVSIGDEEDSPTVIDTVADHVNPFENPDARWRNLYECLNDLPDQERLVLVDYFWNYADEKENISAIAKKYGMTPQQTRKIKDSALARLKQPEYLRDLKKLMDLLSRQKNSD